MHRVSNFCTKINMSFSAHFHKPLHPHKIKTWVRDSHINILILWSLSHRQVRGNHVIPGNLDFSGGFNSVWIHFFSTVHSRSKQGPPCELCWGLRFRTKFNVGTCQAVVGGAGEWEWRPEKVEPSSTQWGLCPSPWQRGHCLGWNFWSGRDLHFENRGFYFLLSPTNFNAPTSQRRFFSAV